MFVWPVLQKVTKQCDLNLVPSTTYVHLGKLGMPHDEPNNSLCFEAKVNVFGRFSALYSALGFLCCLFSRSQFAFARGFADKNTAATHYTVRMLNNEGGFKYS